MDEGEDIQEDVEVEDNDSSTRSMPWSAFNKYFSYEAKSGEHNFLAACKLCVVGKKKIYSCANSSSGNLKSHLKRVHKFSDERMKAEFDVRPAKKRPAAAMERSKSDDFSDLFQKRRITQEDLDKAVDDFVIHTRQPHRVVDNAKFRRMVLLGRPSNLKVTCRQTLRKRLDKHYKTMNANLRKRLDEVPHVAVFADGWSKFRRGFLGVVATWLDPNSVDREFGALDLVRMKGHHTHKKIAGELFQVLGSHGLNAEGKVTKVTTDSASNFVKAFKVYSVSNLPHLGSPDGGNASEDGSEGSNEEESDVDDDGIDSDAAHVAEDDAEVGVLDLDNILSTAELDMDGVRLPPHHRCGSHIANLLGNKDAKGARTNRNYKKLYDSTESKLKVIWRRQNKSDLVAEVIQEGLGKKLQTPGDTRWNSNFDSKRQIVKIAETDEDKLNDTLSKAGLNKLSNSELKFLKEYVHVMQPVALALDILQRDKNMYIGYLLPTVVSLEKKLNQRKEMDGKPLKYCQPLVTTLIAALSKPRRFQAYLHDEDLEMAAALIPTFKLDWIDGEGRREVVKSNLLHKMKRLDAEAQTEEPSTFSQSSSSRPRPPPVPDVDMEQLAAEEAQDDPGTGTQERETTTEPQADDDEELLSAEDDFYGLSSVQCNPRSQEAEAPESAEEELARYLRRVDRSWTVQDCYAKGANGKREFPRLARLFLRLNTALPSSAMVERFFSAVGLSFTSLRNMMGDETLKKEAILSLNFRFWQ